MLHTPQRLSITIRRESKILNEAREALCVLLPVSCLSLPWLCPPYFPVLSGRLHAPGPASGPSAMWCLLPGTRSPHFFPGRLLFNLKHSLLGECSCLNHSLSLCSALSRQHALIICKYLSLRDIADSCLLLVFLSLNCVSSSRFRTRMVCSSQFPQQLTHCLVLSGFPIGT